MILCDCCLLSDDYLSILLLAQFTSLWLCVTPTKDSIESGNFHGTINRSLMNWRPRISSDFRRFSLNFGWNMKRKKTVADRRNLLPNNNRSRTKFTVSHGQQSPSMMLRCFDFMNRFDRRERNIIKRENCNYLAACFQLFVNHLHINQNNLPHASDNWNLRTGIRWLFLVLNLLWNMINGSRTSIKLYAKSLPSTMTPSQWTKNSSKHFQFASSEHLMMIHSFKAAIFW